MLRISASYGTSRGLTICGLMVAILVLFGQCAEIHAAAGYVDAKGLARQHAMEYRDLSSTGLHACKLVTESHQVLVTCGSRSLLIDGALSTLSKPVLWDGASILVPVEATSMIAGLVRGGAISSPKANSYEHVSEFKPERVVASERKLDVARPFKIVIDPGHGGAEPGAVHGGVKEKDINLDVARRLIGYLKAEGITVLSTRQKDVTVSLSQRVRIANTHQPDLFLSVHANAEPSRKERGAMSLHPAEGAPGGAPDLMGRAKAAVENRTFIGTELGAGGPVGKAALLTVAGASFGSYRVQSIDAAQRVQKALLPISGCARTRKGNGLLEDTRGLRVLCFVQAPAVLAEVDFLSNSASRRKLKTSAYRDRIAKALAAAVVDFRDNGGRK